MAKRKIIRRGNKPLNIFDIGGMISAPPIKGVSVLGNVPTQALSDKIPVLSSGSSGGSSFGSMMGSLGSMGAAVGQGVNTAFELAKIADTSGIENNIDLQNNTRVQASSNDELMNEWGSWNKLKDNYSWRDLRGKSLALGAMNVFNSSNSGAMAFSSLGPIGAVAGGVGGLISGLAGWFTGNRKAKKKAKLLNLATADANNRAISSFGLRADNIDKLSDFNMMANYAAYGGPLSGALDYLLANQELNNKYLDNMSKMRLVSLPNSFKNVEDTWNTFDKGGGIHIKKANRGKFTAYCGGKVTSECILRGLHSSNPTIRKRANFARNARKWKHALGGYLLNPNDENISPDSFTHGGIFDLGVNLVDLGGTHEESPLGGVPMGIAPDNTPNLVEEGEVVFNDYVFSNRLHITEKLAKQYNLPKKYKNHTFASIAESMSLESNERPADPISKRGLLSDLSKLMQVLELVRLEDLEPNKFDDGGYKPYSNYVPITDDWYIDEYTRFVNNLNANDPMSMGWMSRINSEEFGPVGGNTFNIPTIKRLAVDRKKGPVHNALFQATKRDLADNTPRLSPTRLSSNPVDPASFAPAPRASVPLKDVLRASSTPSRLSNLGLSDLRYAPAIGAGINSLTDLFGLTNRPDYSTSDMILNAASNTPSIEVEPIGNYLSYDPFDRDYYINKLNAQAASTRRSLLNTSGGNRALTLAGILASDYNYGLNLGDLARKAEEYNLELRERVEGFNRLTNQYNSDARMRAAMANQYNRESLMKNIVQAALMREEAKRRSAAARSANLSNFFDSLGDIGREESSRNMIESNPALGYTIDRRGKVKYKKKKDN